MSMLNHDHASLSTQTAIPCLVMRGGTSKGPYFRLSDLPRDRDTLTTVLLAAVGSPDRRQIDGLGGGQWLTSKVAMVGPSARVDSDVDYLFAQVLIDEARVDYSPNCGNMTSGVGPFAIETGMVQAGDPATQVRIHNVNTGALIKATVKTPHGQVVYTGDAAIDGVPGTAAPIVLRFANTVGSITGRLLPTGHVVDRFDGVKVSCVDVAVPMVIVNADAVGKTGYESKAELDADGDLIERLESIRVQASNRMGMGDPSGRVVPKLCLVSPARNGGHINGRYFVPHQCHEAFPLVGAMCLSAACMINGTVPAVLATVSDAPAQSVYIEHPVGQLEAAIEVGGSGQVPHIQGVGFVRTARPIMEGRVFIPRHIWRGTVVETAAQS